MHVYVPQSIHCCILCDNCLLAALQQQLCTAEKPIEQQLRRFTRCALQAQVMCTDRLLKTHYCVCTSVYYYAQLHVLCQLLGVRATVSMCSGVASTLLLEHCDKAYSIN
jgi:hypothetical protein